MAPDGGIDRECAVVVDIRGVEFVELSLFLSGEYLDATDLGVGSNRVENGSDLAGQTFGQIVSDDARVMEQRDSAVLDGEHKAGLVDISEFGRMVDEDGDVYR